MPPASPVSPPSPRLVAILPMRTVLLFWPTDFPRAAVGDSSDFDEMEWMKFAYSLFSAGKSVVSFSVGLLAWRRHLCVTHSLLPRRKRRVEQQEWGSSLTVAGPRRSFTGLPF